MMTGTPTDEGFDRLTRWIEAETGLCFPEVHHDTILSAAERRAGTLGLSADAFESLLRHEAAEKTLFFNEIVIGETYFFRDERQFTALVSRVLPTLLRDRDQLQLWSATCATGEEPVSLAAVAAHVLSLHGTVRTETDPGYRVLATDLNGNALVRLASGRFPASSFRTDGRIWHGLLETCGTMDSACWHALPGFLRTIETRYLNLLSGTMPEPESMDVVFFRNTLVYMRQEQKTRVVNRIVETLKPGGCLFLSSPEVPTVRHARLAVEEDSGCFFFRKLPASSIAATQVMVSNRDKAMQAYVVTVDRRGGRIPDQRPAAERSAAKPEPRVRDSEIVRGLELASLRARGTDAVDETGFSGNEQDVAGMLTAIVAALGANAFGLADELLDGFEARTRETHISLYLKAQVRKHQGQSGQALELWERARVYDQHFWPALFQAGLAYARSKPERSRELMLECLRAIETDRDGDAYFVLLDGFDLPYYRRMAERQLARSRIS